VRYNPGVDTRLANWPIDEAYYSTIELLSAFSSCLLDDYKIDDQNTNSDVFYVRLSKTKTKKLKSDIKNALKFLKKFPTKDDVPHRSVFKKWANKIDTWHKTLTSYHLEDYNNESHSWKYLGTSLHYLLDALYHLFFKFYNIKTSPHIKHTCKWCGKKIPKSWRLLLSQVIFDYIPLIYLYSSFAQAELSLENNYKPERVVEESFKNVSALSRTILLKT